MSFLNHKQVKTNEIKFQRFGDFMTPLSRNDLMNAVRVKKSSGQIIYIKEDKLDKNLEWIGI